MKEKPANEKGASSGGGRDAKPPAPAEVRFQAVFANSRDAIGVSTAGVHVFVNPAYLELFGFLPGTDLAGKPVLDLIAPGSRDQIQECILRRLRGEPVPSTYETRGRRVDGPEFDMEVNVSQYQENGEDHTLVILRDISGRKRNERELAERGAMLEQIMDTASVAIFLVDKSGRIVHANRRMAEMFGCSLEDLVGSEYVDHVDPTERETGRRKMLALLASKIPAVDLDRLYRRKDDTRFWGHLAGRRYHDAQGNDLGLIGVITDIDARKRSEEALRENQARLDLALQSAHMGVWRWEIAENRRYFDELTCQLLGIDAATFAGTAEEFFRAVHPEDRGTIEAALAGTIEKDLLDEPSCRAVWPDGSIHFLTARGRLVRDAGGRPLRINGILWDITAQRLLEEERIKSQRLESVGTLAGGIAHDFNNLLQGVFGYISMAKLTHDQKEKSLALLEQAEKALHQSVTLTAQLLTFAKGGRPVKKVVDLRPVVENAVALALSGSRVTPEIVVDPNLRAVEADQGQIGQVVQNIVLNADQAMPLGGTIRVALRNISAAAIVPPADLQGDLVEISIRDQGTGIPAEHLARIFDPYFTTKEKGSGLGLATSYSIIRNHGGLLRAHSEVGRGTEFLIYLPASGSRAVETPRPAPPAAARKGRILVMDDEKMIRDLAREMLASLEHEVACAETGETALAAYRVAQDAGRPFDVVILDLTIRGGMGGLETLRKLVEIDPAVKAVVSSGYSEDAALANYRELGFRAVLDKPYSIVDLQGVLDALLI
ncbi:MAG: PAS domain-containing hybrid sensor histidine kinase/response regulator [Candidatus Methylomirabilia bacterium]